MCQATLHIPISPECNNNCMFCNESDRNHRREANAAYQPKIVRDLLKKYNSKVSRVNFTSGEPTLNPELLSFIRQAKGFGYRDVSITTNGRMLAYEKFSRALLKTGISEIIISIHGHTEKIHDALTRSKGSFANTVQGINNISQLSKTHPVRLTFAVTLTKINYPFFAEIITFLNSFNFHEIVINVVQPIQGNMARYFDRLMPKYSDVAAVIEEYHKQHKEIFFEVVNTYIRRKISIIDLPSCVSPRLAEHMGFGELRIIEDAKTDGEQNREHHFEKVVFDDNKGDKIKRNSCRSCLFAQSCNGVYKNYINSFGWEEFIPVTSSNP